MTLYTHKVYSVYIGDTEMKKTIQGFRYDTEKAIKICEIYESNRNDFRHLDCALYVTAKAHRYFMAGFGGAMTIFSHRCEDGSFCGWETIIPVTKEDARIYTEKYAKEEEIEKYFPGEEA